jgi:Tfp pilus assembly protein FimT
MTLIETLIVVSVAALVLVATAAYSIPWIAKESMRSAVYDVQTYLQLARIEAVSRNRDCRFVVNTSNRTLQILDGNGTSTTSDDTELYLRSLPDSVTFARPDAGAAVTLAQIGGGSSYEVVFTADGTVSAGTGEAVLFGGQLYGRIRVFGAGGTQVEHWDGTGWVLGS